ncbi:hypothetical protein KAK06_17555 [Ideonella sp. 4Y11]|uniref:Oxidoreductase-like domain-containing protein n=1 Tax=Ideonella aquatica TaxID=2824119 RepID=A0A940YQQ0_9BURK|nr:oxidoreductase-like domain-containing protein [Ideonella aquatica]MBQ0960766.1 hypothetical protein [Ideonella aquatica]
MGEDLLKLRTEFARLQALLAERGLTMRPPPTEPTTCCGRGCNGCVWEGFYAAAAYWLEQARECLDAADPA